MITRRCLTGGYFLELDFHFDEPYKFKTNRKGLPIMFKDPEEPTTNQFNYVRDFLILQKKFFIQKVLLILLKAIENILMFLHL